MAAEPNSLDFFRRGEVFPFVQSKVNPNDLDSFRRGEVLPEIMPTSVAAVVSPVITTKRRIFIID